MEVRFLGRNHGLTTADIEAKAKAKREVGGLKVSAAAGKTKAVASGKNKAAPKHLHPKRAGHGRVPAWIAEAKDRSKFMIAGGAEATVAANAGVVSKARAAVKKAPRAGRATSSKGHRKGPQPALYQDPKRRHP